MKTPAENDGIEGDRHHAYGRGPSRAGNVLAIGLMSVLGLGSLSWYYANTMMRASRSRETARAAAAKRVQGDSPLPSIGPVGAPAPAVPELMATDVPDPRRSPPEPRYLAEIPLAPAANGMTPGEPVKSTEQIALERQLSGSVFAAHVSLPAAGTEPSSEPVVVPPGGGSDIAALLRPTKLNAARAQRLPGQRLLLPKGAFIDCTLETAIDSTLPGMTTCIVATDVFGVDGNVVLLERGTKLVGETRGQVQQGSARIFVIWSEARTPAGVVVPLDSPGTDELGRSGLAGEVERHFWQRFGAALLVSVIDGAIQAGIQAARSSASAVVVNPSGSQDVLTEILKNTVGIPPTVIKNNGDRIQVLVARDVDFRTVYELRSVAAER